MLRLPNLFLALALLGVLWIYWPFGNDGSTVRIAPRDVQSGSQQSPAPPSAESAPPAAKGPDVADAPAANTPQETAAPGGTTETLDAEAPDKPALQPKRFFRVVVMDGGSLKAGDTTISLSGIAVEDLSGSCEDAAGRRWPCGRFARAALTRLIRGRAILCDVPATGQHKSLSARCEVAGKDLSHWMVSQGWAEPTEPIDESFKKALNDAKKRRRGVWR